MVYDQMCDKKASLSFTAHEIISQRLSFERQPHINNRLVRKLGVFKGLLDEYALLRSNFARLRNWDDPQVKTFDVSLTSQELKIEEMKLNTKFAFPCKFYDSFQDKWFDIAGNKIIFKPFIQPSATSVSSSQWVLEVNWEVENGQIFPCTISPKNIMFFRETHIQHFVSFTIYMVRKRKYYVFNFANNEAHLNDFMSKFVSWLSGEDRYVSLHQGVLQDFLTEPRWHEGGLDRPAKQVTWQLLNELLQSTLTSRDDFTGITWARFFRYGTVSLNFARQEEMKNFADKFQVAVPEKGSATPESPSTSATQKGTSATSEKATAKKKPQLNSRYRELSRRVALDTMNLIWQMSTRMALNYAFIIEETCREKENSHSGVPHYFGKQLPSARFPKLRQMRKTYLKVQSLMKAFYGVQWPLYCQDNVCAMLESRYSLFNAPH